jgi:soluble lytic murein transglycosylase-like protein
MLKRAPVRPLLLMALWLAGSATAQVGPKRLAPLSEKTQLCILAAAQHQRVSPQLLEAIVRHESRGQPLTVLRNRNGSLDVGLMGINSVHFPELFSQGVAPQDLLDECVAVSVGAWKLAKKIARHGYTWWAIGAYHSETPQHNLRYQHKIHEQLVAMGAFRP